MMKEFSGRLAVVTGGGAGMGRELALQLSQAGCHLALCDVSVENLAESKRLCEANGKEGLVVSTHICDVSNESQVQAFAEAVKEVHQTQAINFLFNNAGIAGGGSFVNDNRNDWERCFNISWFGVYYNSRAFLPMLMASEKGHIINLSSVNGFWATSGGIPHTAYSAAKYAIKGFSEALVVDLRTHAPHIKVSVVMPGYIGTELVANTIAQLNEKEGSQEVDMAGARNRFRNMGVPVDEMTDDQLLGVMAESAKAFANNAPTTAAQAATIILDGVSKEEWRILVGEDAKQLDKMVRDAPEKAYDTDFIQRARDTGAWTAW
jgi:NAD(P)-dependent dehydrogenase (short-subunit alcohol dehydrogenase family)